MKFGEVIIITNKLSDYILCEIGTGTREQDRTEYPNGRQSV